MRGFLFFLNQIGKFYKKIALLILTYYSLDEQAGK